MPDKGIGKAKTTITALRSGLHGTKSGRRATRPKLLVSIVNKGEEQVLREILNDLSVSLAFTFSGLGTARTHMLDYLGIGETEKSVVFSLFPDGDESTVMRELRTKMTLYLAGRGISFTVPLSGVSELIAKGLGQAATNKSVEEEKVMTEKDRKYNLIIAAVAANHVDEAMDAAREAGASGGTIIRARATDNEKAEQFIGISLMSEQELLLVLSKKESTARIMDALSEKVGLKTDAGGVIFALPVDKTAGIAVEETREEKAEGKKGD